nr:uncharacterized protein CTRU02_12427 [Colletotrichum truncatum]KAF6784722.1 hypothetical protein CTRU02_12427 [Colletotrichum truncatum]
MRIGKAVVAYGGAFPVFTFGFMEVCPVEAVIESLQFPLRILSHKTFSLWATVYIAA